MIITVTLNAAIDNTLAVPHFRLGKRHRAVDKHASAGGKGINVARALKCLGQPVIATGFTGGAAGTRIIEYLTAESVLNDFVRIGDESRTSTVVIDPTSGEQTEIHERGPVITEAELELFSEKLLYLARGADVCVFSGSLPLGVPEAVYADLVAELHKLGVDTVADAYGDAMRLAVRAEPGMISPNVMEAEELVGREFAEADDDDMAHAVVELRNLGARDVTVTTADGCWASFADEPQRLLRARIEQLDPVSTVGSGDAFLAGFVTARYIGLDNEASLRYGVACGAESTLHFGSGIVDRDAADQLVDGVDITASELPVAG
jgi:1-phosphofructokinase/tagatose 6-phosphate kinase